jgi:predicted nucleotidyltransferase
MPTQHRTSSKSPANSHQPSRWYRGADVPKSVIRRFARDVAEKFHAEKIILFGSHAYGRPHADSDVDILVIMPCRNEIDQAYKIRLAVDRRFSLDLIVRKPQDNAGGLRKGMTSSKKLSQKVRCCMKRLTQEWVRKAESDYQLAVKAPPPMNRSMTKFASSANSLQKNTSKHC